MNNPVATVLLVSGWLPMLVRLGGGRRSDAPATAPRVDRVLLVSTWVLCLALTLLAAFEVQRAPTTQRTTAGALLFLASMAAWTWGRAAQGDMFAQVARAPQRLVVRGPYRWVRHPLYLATTLGTAGHAIAAARWSTSLLWAALAVVLIVRSVREERLMRDAFGAEWDAYARRSLGFLPARGDPSRPS